jgi:DNA polymerase III epsilon subunit-like protein
VNPSRIVVLDLETTGLEPDAGHELWEFGLIVRDPGQPDAEHLWRTMPDLSKADPHMPDDDLDRDLMICIILTDPGRTRRDRITREQRGRLYDYNREIRTEIARRRSYAEGGWRVSRP